LSIEPARQNDSTPSQFESFPKSRRPEQIGGLIQNLLSRLGFVARLEKQAAVTLWPQIVGPKIAEETTALRIDGETLVVKVSRAAWRQQLSFMKPDLLSKMQSEIGQGCITDIRFI
jgi:predicted nucleic acid-binding Zn ribbon protein